MNATRGIILGMKYRSSTQHSFAIIRVIKQQVASHGGWNTKPVAYDYIIGSLLYHRMAFENVERYMERGIKFGFVIHNKIL